MSLHAVSYIVAKAKSACRYGEEVEKYLEVYLRTPGLKNEELARALLARGNARKSAGEKLLEKAQQGTVLPSTLCWIRLTGVSADFQAVARLDPSNRELQVFLRRESMVSPPSSYTTQSFGTQSGKCLFLFVIGGL